MKNAKTVAWGLIASLGLAGLGGITETESLYSIAGIGLIVFGVWAVVLLFRAANQKPE